MVLFHDTYSSTVDLVEQFILVLKANGYHLVTVSQMLGPRAPGSVYGGRDNGPPVNDLQRHPAGGNPITAGHAVTRADAELSDNRHSRCELRRPQQRRLGASLRFYPSSCTLAIASTSRRLSSSSSGQLVADQAPVDDGLSNRLVLLEGLLRYGGGFLVADRRVQRSHDGRRRLGQGRSRGSSATRPSMQRCANKRETFASKVNDSRTLRAIIGM